MSNIDPELTAQLEQFSKDSDRMDIVIEFLTYQKMDILYQERRGVLKKIPQFWLTALKNHEELVFELGNQDDQQALAFLEDIWVSRNPKEPRTYSIEFTFGENPFFEDSVLTKVFEYVESEESDSQAPDEDGFKWTMLNFEWHKNAKPLATAITWKEDQDLCSKYPSVGDDKMPDELGSFFNWFTHPADAYDIGVNIAEDLFPDAIDYYLDRMNENDNDEENVKENAEENVEEIPEEDLGEDV